MIFHEASRRLCAILGNLVEAPGPGRRTSLCWGLTKLHEEIWRAILGETME